MSKHRHTPVRNWFRRHLSWLVSREPAEGAHAAWEARGIITQARWDARDHIDGTEPNTGTESPRET